MKSISSPKKTNFIISPIHYKSYRIEKEPNVVVVRQERMNGNRLEEYFQGKEEPSVLAFPMRNGNIQIDSRKQVNIFLCPKFLQKLEKFSIKDPENNNIFVN